MKKDTFFADFFPYIIIALRESSDDESVIFSGHDSTLASVPISTGRKRRILLLLYLRYTRISNVESTPIQSRQSM